jgi:hypothetical protein
VAAERMQEVLGLVYAPHVLRWSVFVPSASPEQVHGALSHAVDDHSWYWSSPQLVYEPKSCSLDQRPSDIAGGPQRRISLTFAMTPDGTLVSAQQRALGEFAMTERVLVLTFLLLGVWAVIDHAWLTGAAFLTLFVLVRVVVEAIERIASRRLKEKILEAASLR